MFFCLQYSRKKEHLHTLLDLGIPITNTLHAKKLMFRAQRETFAKVSKDAKDSRCCQRRPTDGIAKVGDKNDTMATSLTAKKRANL
jgi:hypothetical protein